MALVNFSGIASGIDSSALIEALLDQQRNARIVPLETNIEELQDTNTAFSELTTLLNTLKDVADRFRLVSGGGVSKEALSSDETVLTASASNSASSGAYGVTVSQLAENATLSLASNAITYTSSSDAIFSGMVGSDTVDFTIGQGDYQEAFSISVDSSTTLSGFVNDFNDQTQNATATLVNTGTSTSPDYQVVISSKYEGQERGAITVDVSDTIDDPDGMPGTNDGAFDSVTLDQAANAQFTIDGIGSTITRQSNTVSDVIPGVTFTLQDTGSATVTVGVDSTTSTANMREFVDAYNEVVKFITENDLIIREENGDEVDNIFGPLADTSLDDNILTSLRSALSSAGISGDTVNILADLGVTTERDGTLAFDEDTFQSALASNPSAVEQITQNLGETLAAVDGTIAQYTRFNGLIDQAEQSNTDLISSYQEKISVVEDQLAKQEETLVAQYARLEALIGELNSQQSALTSILPS